MYFHFRAATSEDIPVLSELIAASVRELQIEYTPEERELALATIFTIDTQLILDGTYSVALSEEGILAGCGGWSKRRTLYGGDRQIQAIAPELLDPSHDAAKIRAIFVHPAYSRQGLGSAILARSEKAAQDAGFTGFEMGSTLAGVPLYTLKGYRKRETITVPIGAEKTITIVRMAKSANPA